MAQIMPLAPAASKAATGSFLTEQGQIPRATTASIATKPILPSVKSGKKLVTVAHANSLIELEERVKNGERIADTIKAEDELNANPALRALIKYLKKISYSDKYSDVQYEYR
jgi:bisphosphoglycerate-dependent phosphoglycerate mutase